MIWAIILLWPWSAAIAPPCGAMVVCYSVALCGPNASQQCNAALGMHHPKVSAVYQISGVLNRKLRQGRDWRIAGPVVIINESVVRTATDQFRVVYR